MPTCEKGLLEITSVQAERGQYGEPQEEWRLKITVNGETQECSETVNPPESFNDCNPKFEVDCNKPITLEVSGYEDDPISNDQLPTLHETFTDWELNHPYSARTKTSGIRDQFAYEVKFEVKPL